MLPLLLTYREINFLLTCFLRRWPQRRSKRAGKWALCTSDRPTGEDGPALSPRDGLSALRAGEAVVLLVELQQEQGAHGGRAARSAAGEAEAVPPARKWPGELGRGDAESAQEEGPLGQAEVESEREGPL